MVSHSPMYHFHYSSATFHVPWEMGTRGKIEDPENSRVNEFILISYSQGGNSDKLTNIDVNCFPHEYNMNITKIHDLRTCQTSIGTHPHPQLHKEA